MITTKGILSATVNAGASFVYTQPGNVVFMLKNIINKGLTDTLVTH